MTLHGDIRVNGHAIASWSAMRVDDGPGPLHEYDVEVSERVMVDHNLYASGPSRTTRLTHHYDDGALGLAAKVLAWASITGVRPEQPKEEQ